MHNKKIELKNILFIAFIFILAIMIFVFVVGYIISSVDPNHSIVGYSIAISFVGIFATFGGAFLGAKISGDNARKLFEIQQKHEREERRDQVITQLTLSMNYIVKLTDRIAANYRKDRKIYRYLYHRKNTILNKNYTAKIDRNELKILFYELIEKKEVNMICVEDYIYENYIYFVDFLNKIMADKDIIHLNKIEQKQLFLFRQIVDTLAYMFYEEKSKNLYIIDLNDIEKELAFIEYYVQLCILLMEIQEWTILKDK
ncbi:hypothetical protein [Staphylococcus sp. GDX8P80P]|uniref:hypothetical protein n=1 Tax=Staphylococcus sp. GDX8P80P TaxID=2804104 RepID=UPI001AEC4102|nr:hypothetical protein [Staphylococcus sp. GDX8P80P]